MSSSVFQQIIDTVVTTIQALGLSGIASADIIDLDHDANIQEQLPGRPGIVVMPITDSISDTGGTNIRDDVEYVVGIGIFSDSIGSQTSAANKDKHALWREQIRAEFINQRLSTLAYTCKYRGGGPLYDAAARRLRQTADQTIFLRFYSRESRT